MISRQRRKSATIAVSRRGTLALRAFEPESRPARDAQAAHDCKLVVSWELGRDFSDCGAILESIGFAAADTYNGGVFLVSLPQDASHDGQAHRSDSLQE